MQASLPPTAGPQSKLCYFPGSALQYLNFSSNPNHQRRGEPGPSARCLQGAAAGMEVWRNQPKPWEPQGILPKSQQMQMTPWKQR